jgi:hypothetical protein
LEKSGGRVEYRGKMEEIEEDFPLLAGSGGDVVARFQVNPYHLMAALDHCDQYLYPVGSRGNEVLYLQSVDGVYSELVICLAVEVPKVEAPAATPVRRKKAK